MRLTSTLIQKLLHRLARTSQGAIAAFAVLLVVLIGLFDFATGWSST